MGSIRELCAWFDQLDFSKQMACLDFMNEKNKTLEGLDDDEELNNLYALWLKIKILIEEIEDEDKITSKLIKFGLEKITAKSFYNFCLKVSLPELDAKIINEIDIESLENVVDFIIEKMFLYEDYLETSFDEFVLLTKLNSKESASKVLRFLQRKVFDVCNREISPQNLEKNLLNEYEISSDRTDIIIKRIKSNISELQMSFLLKSVKNISAQIESIKDVLYDTSEE